MMVSKGQDCPNESCVGHATRLKLRIEISGGESYTPQAHTDFCLERGAGIPTLIQ